MVVPAALSAVYTIVLFSFSLLFHSVFPKPWRCLWPVSAPSVMWGFSWSAWLGSGPSLGPSHLAQRASRPGLHSLEACVFWPRGKLVCLYQSIIGKGCEVIFFRGAYAIWYSCKPYSLPMVKGCKHTGAKEFMKASLGIFILHCE